MEFASNPNNNSASNSCPRHNEVGKKVNLTFGILDTQLKGGKARRGNKKQNI